MSIKTTRFGHTFENGDSVRYYGDDRWIKIEGIDSVKYAVVTESEDNIIFDTDQSDGTAWVGVSPCLYSLHPGSVYTFPEVIYQRYATEEEREVLARFADFLTEDPEHMIIDGDLDLLTDYPQDIYVRDATVAEVERCDLLAATDGLVSMRFSDGMILTKEGAWGSDWRTCIKDGCTRTLSVAEAVESYQICDYAYCKEHQ